MKALMGGDQPGQRCITAPSPGTQHKEHVTWLLTNQVTVPHVCWQVPFGWTNWRVNPLEVEKVVFDLLVIFPRTCKRRGGRAPASQLECPWARLTKASPGGNTAFCLKISPQCITHIWGFNNQGTAEQKAMMMEAGLVQRLQGHLCPLPSTHTEHRAPVRACWNGSSWESWPCDPNPLSISADCYDLRCSSLTKPQGLVLCPIISGLSDSSKIFNNISEDRIPTRVFWW